VPAASRHGFGVKARGQYGRGGRSLRGEDPVVPR